MTPAATHVAVSATPLATTVARGYFDLTKPGITLFVGITAAAGYVITGAFDASTLGWLLVATMALSGGASALNQVAEHRFDSVMRRTRTRPIPAAVIAPARAARFGWTLSAVGAGAAALFLPQWSLVFLLVCHVSYVSIYTPLKRRTPLCTLVGALPGALPVLAGSAAAGHTAAPAAIALAGLLFTWQIPHFLSIGWVARDDYARGGFPMLGVVEATGHASARVSLHYAWATLALAALVVVAGGLGWTSAAIVIGAGMAYVYAAVGFARERAIGRARRLFFASLLVLPVMLVSIMLDMALRG